jgi:membrane protein involved in colicin uptake
LPYARTAPQGGAASSPQIAPTTGELTDWDRQQDLKRRQLEQAQTLRQQAEAFRRQQTLEQQRQKIRQQAELQQQREQQQRRQQVARPAAGQLSRIQAAPAAVRVAVAQKRVAAAPAKAMPQAVKVSPPSVAQRPASYRTGGVGGLLREPGSLRAAIVLKEILDRPLALRNL